MSGVTIADVAKLAGVSIKTVSRVTNNEPNVRAGTRARVVSAIETLNYMPNPSARSLAARRSYLIGLIYDNPSASYLVNIQEGALRTSHAEGYDLIIHPCDYKSPALADEIVNMIAQSKVDGLVLTPPLSDLEKLVDRLDEVGTPYVLIAPSEVRPHRAAVHTNDREACAEMTYYLYSLGHQRIGFVLGHPDHGAVNTRFDGYRDGLERSGLEYDRQLVVQGYNSFDSGVAAGQELLGGLSRPTAIFAANDDMAAGVLKVAHERGIAVPGQLSVAGFDDVPLAAQLWPALTTIRQPIRSMAAMATQFLTRRLAGATDTPVDNTIPSSLVVRESTGPAPAQ